MSCQIRTYICWFTLSQKKTNCNPLAHPIWKCYCTNLWNAKLLRLTEGLLYSNVGGSEKSQSRVVIHPLNGPLSGTNQVSRYQKGKTNIWILLEQETVSGIGISWAVCKSAPHSRQITTPAPHHSVSTGRMPFLLPNQQCQSTGLSSVAFKSTGCDVWQL